MAVIVRPVDVEAVDPAEQRVEPGMELHRERLAGLVQARTALALAGLRRVAGGIAVAIQALRTATATIIEKFDNRRDATRERSGLKRYINAGNPTARRRHTWGAGEEPAGDEGVAMSEQ
jgi:hypothetical protein